MKILVIGGNRFVGLRFTHVLDQEGRHELHIVNRTGQAPHAPGAVVHKLDRAYLRGSYVDRDWDVIVDFACYTEGDARSSVDFFGRVGRYVMISTSSVYDDGQPRDENAFDPRTFDLKSTPLNDYQDGKRRAEAVFTQTAKFPTVFPRFPVILGPDDYTERLKKIVQRVAQSQPINSHSSEPLFSFVSSECACRFLRWTIEQSFTGPINVASPSGVSFHHILKESERATGKKAILLHQKDKESHNPFSGTKDCHLDVSQLKRLGFECAELRLWLPQLVAELSGKLASHRLH